MTSPDPNDTWVNAFRPWLAANPMPASAGAGNAANASWIAAFRTWIAANPLPAAAAPVPPVSGGGGPPAVVGSGTSVKALDMTNSPPNAAWFTQAYKDGFRLYIYPPLAWGVSTPRSDAQTLFQNALAAGLKVAIYSRNPTWWKQAIQAVGSYVNHVQFFAIDIETDPGVKATQAMVTGIQGMGVRPVIYSGYGMWPQIMGASNTSFSSLPLWDTNAGSATSMNPLTYTPNFLLPKPVAYGGWNVSNNMRIGIQQTFETVYQGQNIDINSFAADFLTVP